jgi:hypothetical protein
VTEKPDFVSRGYSPAAGENLKVNLFTGKTDDLGQGGTVDGVYLGQVIIFDPIGPDGNNVSRYGFYLAVYLSHLNASLIP